MPNNTKPKKKSIIDNTVACSHCGHRVLPKNLADHMKRIHAVELRDEKFVNSLKRTRSELWWQAAFKTHEPVSLGSVFYEVKNEPDPKTSGLSKRTTRKKSKNPFSSQMQRKPISRCNVCGVDVAPADMEKHIARHVYFQPLRNDDEIHCPICGLNIKISNLKSHLHVVHTNLSQPEVRSIIEKVRIDEFYGMKSTSPMLTKIGPIMVSSRGWLQCPECSIYLKVKSLRRHYFDVHKQEL